MALHLSAKQARGFGVIGKGKKKSLSLPTKGDLAAEAVIAWCKANGLPEPMPEHYFAKPRMWRFDLAWDAMVPPTYKLPGPLPYRVLLAVEFQGGNFSGGAHTRGKHFESDCQKFSAAASLGWRVMPVTYDMLNRGELWPLLAVALAQ
jgi:hypothetical protein